MTAGSTLASLLELVQPSLRTVLGEEDVRRLAGRGAGIPLDPVALVGLEVPLTGPGTDLSVMLAARHVLRRLAACWGQYPDLGSDPVLPALLAALTDRGHPLYRQVSDAWLEFDVGSGAGSRPNLLAAPAAAAAPALARVLGAAPPSVAALDHLLAALAPTGATVQHVGVMHARAAPELRCILHGTGPGRLDLLPAGGMGTGLRSLLDRYGSLTPRASVALGLGVDGLAAPRVGVELHLPRLADAERVLARLEADGLADARTAERVLAWHGHQVVPDGTGLPARFRALRELTRGRRVPALVRRVHHVKVSVGPGSRLGAKAYLGATPVTVGAGQKA